MAAGQGLTLTGVVTLGATPPRALTAGWVVLHRVTMTQQGPIDSARLGPGGRYRLRIAAVDSTATYLVSVFHDGVAYFSQPIIPGAFARPRVDTLRVFDTTTAGPPLAVRQRLLSVAAPKADGSRDVLELQELDNPGDRTRIAADTLHPVWTGRLPAGAIQFSVGQGDFSAEAVARHGDTVALFGAIQPGGGRQLAYNYILPGGTGAWMVPVDHPLEKMLILLEDTTARVTGPGLRALGVRPIERRYFAEYEIDHVRAGALVAVTFPHGPFRIDSLIPFIAGGLGVILALGFWWALRRAPPAPPAA